MRRFVGFVGAVAIVIATREVVAQPLRLGPEFQANTYTTGYQIRPAACRSSGGDFVLVWSSDGQDGSGGGVFGQRYASNGTRAGTEFQINTGTVSAAGYGIFSEQPPAICCDPSGGFVVAYPGLEDFSPPFGNGGVFARRYDSAGDPLAAEFVVNTYSGASEDRPSIACAPGGGFVIAWQSFDYPGQDGDESGVFALRYDSAGAAMGAAFQVNSHTIGRQMRPSVCGDSSGGFTVAWTSSGQDDCCTYGSFARRFDSGGAPLGGDIVVNDPAEANEDQRDAQVACGPTGEFVVVWSADGSVFYNDLVGRRYDSSGGPLGGQFLVNTFTPGPQGYPDGYGSFAVGADGAGDFVVVWNDDSDYGNIDGSYNAVTAQKFASSGARLGSEFRVNQFTLGWQAGDNSGLGLGIDAGGDFVIVWGSSGADGTYRDGDGFGIAAQRFLGSPVVPPDSASDTVGAGGTVSTDPENDGVSPGDPLETSITSPVAGTIDIDESSASPSPPPGFAALDYQVIIDAPAASVADPLILRFSFDGSILPPGAVPGDVDVFRDGQAVPDCTGAPSAVPDPCVSLRESIPGGVRLTVLTSNTASLLRPRELAPRATATTWTFAIPPCPASPRDPCRGAEKSILIVKDSADDAKDKLIWKWIKGNATTLDELDDPISTATYAFCIYAGTAGGLIADAVVPPDALKWTATGTTGFKYKDQAGASDGVTAVKVKSGATGKAKALLKGKGNGLDDPELGDLPLPVTAQLVNLDSGVCLQGLFDALDVIENDAAQFKAKAQ